jgi:hypothetical protein
MKIIFLIKIQLLRHDGTIKKNMKFVFIMGYPGANQNIKIILLPLWPSALVAELLRITEGDTDGDGRT